MADLKKTIDEYPSEEQSMQILWNVLDPDSKRIAMADKMDGKSYTELRYLFCRMILAQGDKHEVQRLLCFWTYLIMSVIEESFF